jgi:ribonuclease P protein component
MKRSLTRRERLRKSSEISRLFSGARRVERSGIRLLFQKNDVGWNRFGCGVARGCRTAVLRNREKRLSREAYRHLKGRLADGWDLFVIVRRPGATYSDRYRDFGILFSEAGLLT